MLELLRRFEDESLEQDIGSDDDGGDELAARLEGIDLDHADYDTLWGLLSENERQKFTKMIANPASEELRQLFDSQELLTGCQDPWWSSQEVSQIAPVVKQIPESMAKGRFNASLLFNVLHLSLTYAYTVRTFAVSTLTLSKEAIQAADEPESMKGLILALSPFLGDKKSTTMFTSVDGVVTDWASHLAELPKPELLTLLTEDAKQLFQVKLVVVDEDNRGSHHDYCMRFLSDMHDLFAGHKKSAHIAHKLTFYMAFMTNLHVEASKQLALAIQSWQAKNQGTLQSSNEI